MTESAIPPDLVCPRHRPHAIPEDYNPPFPAWTARQATPTPGAVMAYLGTQALTGDSDAALALLLEIDRLLDGPDGCLQRDLARTRDAQGFDTFLIVAYWTDEAQCDRWLASFSPWWDDPARETGPVGIFREIYRPTRDRYETLFSSQSAEGIGTCLGGLSQPIQEHGYWGSMRDRLPVAQTDGLASDGGLRLEPLSPARLRVLGHDNLALIRSGQDWRETGPKERARYLEEVEPVLRDGMDFLTSHGLEVGCYANRYLRLIDRDGTSLERSYGLSQWRSLADMEAWAENHPTHVRIFGNFMEMVSFLEGKVDLRLFHEVSVLVSGQQTYDYVNCPMSAGLLNAFPDCSVTG